MILPLLCLLPTNMAHYIAFGICVSQVEYGKEVANGKSNRRDYICLRSKRESMTSAMIEILIIFNMLNRNKCIECLSFSTRSHSFPFPHGINPYSRMCECVCASTHSVPTGTLQKTFIEKNVLIKAHA